jgi:hypothetical protein
VIDKNELVGVRDVDFRWVTRVSPNHYASQYDTLFKEKKVLQYRVQRGDGFRGWGEWQDVREENEE